MWCLWIRSIRLGFIMGATPSTPSETPAGPEAAAPARYLFVDINTIDQRLTEWAGDANRVFWVQWFESDTDPGRGAFSAGEIWHARGGRDFPGLPAQLVGSDPTHRFRLGGLV